MWEIIIGLIAVMIANVLLGASIANLKDTFSREKMLKGLVKVGCIVVAVLLMWYCSYLNADIMVANIGGVNVNLLDGMRCLFMAGIVFYGGQDLNKLKDIIKVKVEIVDPNERSTVKIPTENIIKRDDV